MQLISKKINIDQQLFWVIKMKTCQYFFLLILLLVASPQIFSQLDSVYYLGPSQGSVTGGAIQSTDNFTDNILVIESEQKVSPLNRSNDSQNNYVFGWNPSQLPEYKYIDKILLQEN